MMAMQLPTLSQHTHSASVGCLPLMTMMVVEVREAKGRTTACCQIEREEEGEFSKRPSVHREG